MRLKEILKDQHIQNIGMIIHKHYKYMYFPRCRYIVQHSYIKARSDESHIIDLC